MGYKREKKIFGKGQRVVLDAFTGDGEDSNIRFEVVDYRYSLSPWKNKRSIEFFNSGRYIYSTVYLSPHRHFHRIPQKRKFLQLLPCLNQKRSWLRQRQNFSSLLCACKKSSRCKCLYKGRASNFCKRRRRKSSS